MFLATALAVLSSCSSPPPQTPLATIPATGQNPSPSAPLSSVAPTEHPPSPSNIIGQNVSGLYLTSQIWSGKILVTGNVVILQNLTILAGTTAKFDVQDDRKTGDEVSADGFNDLDPTRLVSYGKTHASLVVLGKLTAVGTPEKRILFTSAAEKPQIADWEAVLPLGDGSIIEYAIVEWSRNGITLGVCPSNGFGVR